MVQARRRAVGRGIVLRVLLLLALWPAAREPLAAEAPVRDAEPPAAWQKDDAYLQPRALLSAVDDILKRAAEQRSKMQALPSKKNYLIPPLWTETREDRERNIRALLDAALEIVTDAPVVALQRRLQARRDAIADLRARIATLREERLVAPEDGFLPGVFTETQSSIDARIADLRGRIAANEDEIAGIKREVKQALAAAGVTVSDDQLDLLLDSVLGADFVRLVTAFQAARAIDERLAALLAQSEEDITAARRYFAMHAALFAMLLHAQDVLIDKIDTVYLAKLKGLLNGIEATRQDSHRLLEARNRPDQHRALEANLKSQDFAEKVASFYRDYLLTQRRQLAEARDRTLHDLQIADNTYETVEASFQLHALMEDARTSFEALQRLEAPGFDQVFKNEALRREFESLTRKLGPTS